MPRERGPRLSGRLRDILTATRRAFMIAIISVVSVIVARLWDGCGYFVAGYQRAAVIELIA